MAIEENSAGAVVFRLAGGTRLFLLLHYESGHWDFVKGNIEKGEKELETAEREAQEETGICDLAFIEGFKEKINYFYKRDNKLTKKSVVFFLAETKTKEIKLSHEHIGFVWLPFEEALKKLTHKNAKDLLEKAEKLLDN